MSDNPILYRILRPLLGVVFQAFYHPAIVNKEYIPQNGRAVIAGNHKHALDPILVDVSTSRVVHTLAKRELHDGCFGGFFRAIGTIPVDLHADHNREALHSAVDFLNQDCLINVSPEAKRNYTKEILLPFKYGAVVMAKRTNSMIVPYAITGEYKFWSRDLKITFGKPLDITDLSIEDANETLYQTVKGLILAAREEYTTDEPEHRDSMV